MQLAAFQTEFLPSLYNALPSAEEADQKVRAQGVLDRVLSEAGPVFIKCGVNDQFGVSLLHKHNGCSEGVWMTEYQAVINGEQALVTKPTLTPPTNESAVPTTWRVDDGIYHPLEFSTDPRAKLLFAGARVPKGFLNEFADILDRHSASGFLGLAIVDRELYHLAINDEMGVEYSTSDPQCCCSSKPRQTEREHDRDSMDIQSKCRRAEDLPESLP